MHGVYGGITANGTISMAVFSERQALPKVLTSELSPSVDEPGAFDVLSETREGLDGPVRFVHNTYYFDIELARSIRDWLDDKINSYDRMRDA